MFLRSIHAVVVEYVNGPKLNTWLLLVQASTWSLGEMLPVR